MKVLCINDNTEIGLKSLYYTKGRWYEVACNSAYSHMFYIISDNGHYPSVERKNFITLEEWRNNKINEIIGAQPAQGCAQTL